MHTANPFAHGFEFFRDRFYDKKEFGVDAQFAFPSVNRPDAGNDVDAGRFAFFNKRGGYLFAKFYGIDGTKYNYLIHFVTCVMPLLSFNHYYCIFGLKGRIIG